MLYDSDMLLYFEIKAP